MYTLAWEDSMSRSLFVIAFCSALALGCGGSGRYLQRGVERYEHTDYRGALKQWNELNGSEGSMNDRVLTRYLVYRGLTHYHLSQRSLALVFLSRGKEVSARVPAGTINTMTVAEMDKALADLNAPPAAKSEPAAATKSEPSAAPPAETSVPATPPAATGEALVSIKTPGKGPAPAKTTPAPAKTTPAPAKTTQPSTRTSPAVQSTSPK
jgi:hypothetical protein